MVLNVLVKKPLRVNLLNREGNIKTVYIFVGNVPDNIKKGLDKLSSNNKIDKNTAKIFLDFYGKKWQKILAVDIIHKETKGGDNDEDADVTLADIYKLTEFESLEDSEEEKLLPVKPSKVTEKKSIPSRKQKQRPLKPTVKYIYIDLFEFDDFILLRKKIAYATNIPMYKQNLWYKHVDTIHNLQYTISYRNDVTNVNIMNDIIKAKHEEYINETPILINYYNMRSVYKVNTYDSFSIIKETLYDRGIYEINLFNLDDFINKTELVTIKDKTSIEILYYGFVLLFWPMISNYVWNDYVTNSDDDLAIMYPDIHIDKTRFKTQLELESKITNEALDFYTNKSSNKKYIEKNLFLSIKNSIIYVQSFITINFINLRNLFDILEINGDIALIKYHAEYKGKNIMLHKKAVRPSASMTDIIERNTPTININTMLIRMPIEEIPYLDLLISSNGDIFIYSQWPEDKMYDFPDIIKIVSKYVNAFIDKLNNFNSSVINSNYVLKKMDTSNVKFLENNISLIYRHNISYNEFLLIENILSKYLKANIIEVVDNPTRENDNILEYYFTKGMYKFDVKIIENNISTNNYYNYLTNIAVKNKWRQFYENSRRLSVIYKYGNVQILIEGIKEEEWSIIYIYIINIFNNLQNDIKKTTNIKKTVVKYEKKNVKTLRHQDPVLYDFKREHKSSMIYSRICQKEHQPVILNDEEYDSLDKKSRENNVVNYWNFTTHTPAYYYCPNKKYPYLQFTVNKHPKNYCLPCCKIKPPQKSDDDIKSKTRKLIYDHCLKNHIYESEADIKVDTNSDIRYIMVYGKNIYPRHICRLPEETVSALLYNISVVKQSDKKKYYLYGVDQNLNYVKNVGYITTLAFSLDKSVRDMCIEVTKLLKKDTYYFNMILDGAIIKYFANIDALIESINENFININKKGFNSFIDTKNHIPWNLIFIDIAYYYLYVISVIFEDFSSQSQEIIKIQLLDTLVNIKNQNYKYIVLIKKDTQYNPIYYLNHIIYFRTFLIDKKLFSYQDSITDVIYRIYEFSDTNEETTSKEITLRVYERFMNSILGKKYSITKYFINNHNKCYYIQIQDGINKIYMPVAFSRYNLENLIEIEYKPYEIKKYKTSFNHINKFIRDFNKWIMSEYEKRNDRNLMMDKRNDIKYTYITVDKWILLDNIYDTKSKNPNKVIGFIHNNMNYYHQPLPMKYAKKLKNAKFQRILYHPDDINKNLVSNKIMSDDCIKNIVKNAYNYHLYELFLLELTHLLNKDRNLQMRTRIKKNIIEINSESLLDNIKKDLTKYYEKNQEYQFQYRSDLNILSRQITDYNTTHRNKKILLERIDNTIYNFDKVTINELKMLTHKVLIKELTKLSKRIVSIKSDVEVNKFMKDKKNFPNIFIPCQEDSVIYCKKNKLIITQKNLNTLIEILVGDIKNPFKSAWIFSPIFISNIVNYLQFIKRPNEQITMEFTN